MDIISTQVLQGFYVNITRKIAKPLSFNKAQIILKRYLSWQVVTNTPEIILTSCATYFSKSLNIQIMQF
ncbi:conserved hypothetical protein [Beggiatoa sp. PS]|nr:conserved hypothetical protein [Beggiatoa sp. PS]